MVKDGALGKFVHRGEPNQTVIRLNRDTAATARSPTVSPLCRAGTIQRRSQRAPRPRRNECACYSSPFSSRVQLIRYSGRAFHLPVSAAGFGQYERKTVVAVAAKSPGTSIRRKQPRFYNMVASMSAARDARRMLGCWIGARTARGPYRTSERTKECCRRCAGLSAWADGNRRANDL
jgi:hypothetical protein